MTLPAPFIDRRGNELKLRAFGTKEITVQMRSRMRSAWIALLLAGGLSLNAAAQTPDAKPALGTLTGRVSDERGVPIAGAQLSAPSTDRVAETDTSGTFSLQLPVGSRMVTVRKLGFQPRSVLLDVPTPDGSAQNIVLTRAHTLDTVRVTTTRYGAPPERP